MELAALFAKEVIKGAVELLKSAKWRSADIEPDLAERLHRHLVYVSKWSSSTHAIGLRDGRSLFDTSVPLSFSTVPRSSRVTSSGYEVVSENFLLESPDSVAILGDPGSGKTTTLKRIAQLLLTQDSNNNLDLFQYPILVRIRELHDVDGIIQHISSIVGLNYNRKLIERVKVVKDEKDNDKEVIERKEEYYCGKRRLEGVLIDFLEDTRALVLIDGLDEALATASKDYRRDLVSLAMHCTKSKLLVTCRSGDYASPLDGFRSLEILSLTLDQTENIARLLLGAPADFISSLAEKQYRELWSRPLFLSLLMLHYRESGYLPEKPAHVYKKVVQLALEKWDRERGVIRLSKYGGFDPHRKQEFLEEVSFLLTYKHRKKSFDTSDLIDAYKQICDAYALPENECELVAKEIESHTGLLVESYDGCHEFSHLCIQEYLCAEYLVHDPYSDRLSRYLADYPAPLAVATALSRNPSIWFAALILGSERRMSHVSADSVEILIDRICIEKPYLRRSKELGFAILYLAMNVFVGGAKNLVRFLRYEHVAESLVDAPSHYVAFRGKSEATGLEVKQHLGYAGEFNLRIPEHGCLGASFVDYLLDEGKMVLREAEGRKAEYLLMKPLSG